MIKKSLVFLLLLIVLSSCKKTELNFSCDPVINEFVVKNHEELSKIDIKELVSYNLQLQKAVFNSWNEQKKRDVWTNKLQYVINHTSLTVIEKTHIHKLILHINEGYFKKENREKYQTFRSQFAGEWVKYAMDELKWSKQFIAFIVYRLYTDQSQFDFELSGLKPAGTSLNTNSESGSCDCNSSSDYCGGIVCHSGGCSVTTGCGWLWSMSCNGNCY